MPPKGSRGRGRGRAGATAPAATSRVYSQAQDEQTSSAETLISMPPNEPPPNASTSTTAVDRQHDASQEPSPNTSPASAPTETPAPTPVKQPVQRLDSLGVSGRGAMGIGRGTGRAMTGKFKPKAVRRGVEERKQAEQDEQTRREERDLAAQRARDTSGNIFGGRGGRGGGRGDTSKGGGQRRGRGRGDAMGRGGLDRNTKALREASGLFGIAPAGADRKPAATSFGGGTKRGPNSGASGGSGISRAAATQTPTTKSGPTTRATKVKQETDLLSQPSNHVLMEDESQILDIKPEIPEPVYPEEQEGGSPPAPRIDIEQINLVTDDEEDSRETIAIGKSKGKGRAVPNKGGLRPVRLHREEHKKRITMVNTEPAASPVMDRKIGLDEEANEGGMFMPAYEEVDAEIRGYMDFYRDGKKWAGAWRDDDEVQVKYDPSAVPISMDTDMTIDPAVSSTDFKNPAEQPLNTKEPTISPLNGKERVKVHRRAPRKDNEPVLQTEEDKAEYLRQVEDIQILAQELGGLQRSLAVENADGVIDMDMDMNYGPQSIKDKEGRLYLFQFPPILPPLFNQIKKEEGANSDVEMMQVDAATSSAAAAIDLTIPDSEEAVVIKTEPDLSSYLQVRPELVKEEGSIGTLVVRKSGKVELNWGGTILKLGRGAESEFLTTTMVIDGLNQQLQDETTGFGLRRQSTMVTGTASGMGRVMGKFVATPDWDTMIEME